MNKINSHSTHHTDEIINEATIKDFISSLPVPNGSDSRLTSIQLLENKFDEQTLKDEFKLYHINKEIGGRLLQIEPFTAEEMISKAITLSVQLYSSSNPELRPLYLLKSEAMKELGNVDAMYDSLNQAFLIATVNFKFNSLEILEVLNCFRKFSKMIEETGEHEIYCEKMEKMMNKLKAEQSNEIDAMTLLYYKISILDDLTSFSRELYTVESLKNYYSKFEEIKESVLLKDLQKNSCQLENNVREVYILYCYIKIKSFFKKESKLSSLIEMFSLIKEIKSTHNSEDKLVKLVQPYLFILKTYINLGETKNFENFLLEEWCELIDSLAGENQLLSANYSLLLIKTIISTNNREYNLRLSNLLNFAGENYSHVFKFEGDSNIDSNYIYAELSYFGALINKDNANMIPWSLISSACKGYFNILGEKSEKFKKAASLSEVIEKQHNVQSKE